MGIVVILIGVILLLSTTGALELRSVWGLVALLFVFVGLWTLIRSEFRNLVGPVMVIAIAGTFFLRNVGILPDEVISVWWPLFIVLFGLLLVINRSRRQQRRRLEGDASGEIAAAAIFGGDSRRLVTDTFTGAELITIFGDTMVDLRDSDIRSRPAIIETVTLFGDTEIRVPDDWTVRVETLNVFGETIDRRPRSAGRGSDSPPDLIVTGVTLFGETEISD